MPADCCPVDSNRHWFPALDRAKCRSTHGPRTTPLAIPIPGWVGGSTRSRSRRCPRRERRRRSRRSISVRCRCHAHAAATLLRPQAIMQRPVRLLCFLATRRNAALRLVGDRALDSSWTHHDAAMFRLDAVTRADACVNAGCADKFVLRRRRMLRSTTGYESSERALVRSVALGACLRHAISSRQ